MELAAVMSVLKAKGKPNTILIYRRHGVQEESYGVSYADLGALIKKVGTDHPLALKLWQTGVHDARVLATKIADPARMTRSEVEQWIADAGNYVITDAVSGIAARTAEAVDLARSWIQSDEEWKSAAGWNVSGLLALDGRLPEKRKRELIGLIRRRIHAARNRTRHSMNGFLIGFGANPKFRAEALEVARAIGKVEVDHGETGCKTPDATDYIRKMASRASRAVKN